MSVDTFVFLIDERLPSAREWQRVLDEEGTGIVIEPTDDLRGHTGYLPCRFRGHDSGFEWYYGVAEETAGRTPDEVGGRTHAVNFVTHSDMRELICAMIAGAVLTRLADGLVFDEELGEFVDGKTAYKLAKAAETEHLRD